LIFHLILKKNHSSINSYFSDYERKFINKKGEYVFQFNGKYCLINLNCESFYLVKLDFKKKQSKLIQNNLGEIFKTNIILEKK
jgi:hypothetical protein